MARAKLARPTAFRLRREAQGGIIMTIRMFFTILAVLSFLFGVGFVLAPDQVLANYGIEHSPPLALLGRLFGGTLLTLGVKVV
jgi:hypothetical protein